MTGDEIIALTLKNKRAAGALELLIQDGILEGLLSRRIMDHKRAILGVWQMLKPEPPSVLPFNYRQWLRALRNVYLNGNILEDLDSEVQRMILSGHKDDSSVIAANNDWNVLFNTFRSKGSTLEAYAEADRLIRSNFDSWPEPVRDRITKTGSLDDQLAAMKKSIEFEIALKQAAGIAAGIPR